MKLCYLCRNFIGLDRLLKSGTTQVLIRGTEVVIGNGLCEVQVLAFLSLKEQLGVESLAVWVLGIGYMLLLMTFLDVNTH